MLGQPQPKIMAFIIVGEVLDDNEKRYKKTRPWIKKRKKGSYTNFVRELCAEDSEGFKQNVQNEL